MPVYIVTGKLGSGKTLSMVGRMKEYLESGRPVATNIDLDLRKLCQKRPKAALVRLPDKPSADDLVALGQVHGTAREELNGALVLDECGTWLNARTYADKGRQAIIDWLLHSRKLGWDVFLIVQNVSLMDKQIRDALCEYSVTCRRLDRMKIPFVGRLIPLLTLGMVKGQMPKIHLALVRYGSGAGSVHADTWMYRGTSLYAAYQSVQVIESVGTGEARGSWAHCWYATEREIARWPRKPKPKLPEVLRLRSLSRDRQWHWARELAGAAS